MHKYKEKPNKNQIFQNDRGKVIGRLIDKTLQKSVNGSRHMLRKPKSWACDKSVIEEAKSLGGITIEITDLETDIKYRTGFDTLQKYGLLINRGFGEQIALPMAYWSTDDKDNPQLKLL
jgi:hypothetical protein